MPWDRTDYKYSAQLEAEELAEHEHGCDFYDLPEEEQLRLYECGLSKHWEAVLGTADARRKRLHTQGA